MLGWGVNNRGGDGSAHFLDFESHHGVHKTGRVRPNMNVSQDRGPPNLNPKPSDLGLGLDMRGCWGPL